MVHLSDEQLKATASVMSTIKLQLGQFKEASEQKSARAHAMKRAKETALE